VAFGRCRASILTPGNMLPNNLADWPSAVPRPSTGAARHRHPVAALVGLILFGGLIGIGFYHWVIPVDVGPNVNPEPTGVAQPAGRAILTPETTGATSEDGSPIPESRSPTPEINVSGLLGNQTESQNWAGYAAAVGAYTAVSATWTIPNLAFNSSLGIDAAWVGIGGLRSRDLIQAGTQQTVSRGGTQVGAWIELLPRPPETVPLAIGPGDSIEVSITQQGPENWLIAFVNTSSGLSYQVSKHYASSSTSVEWIAEAPSAGRGRPLPLDDFGTIHFTHVSAAQADRVINMMEAGAHAITMITPSGQHLVEPSAPGADGGSFSVTRTSTPSPRRRDQ
jgi:hypothetical protein